MTDTPRDYGKAIRHSRRVALTQPDRPPRTLKYVDESGSYVDCTLWSRADGVGAWWVTVVDVSTGKRRYVKIRKIREIWALDTR